VAPLLSTAVRIPLHKSDVVSFLAGENNRRCATHDVSLRNLTDWYGSKTVVLSGLTKSGSIRSACDALNRSQRKQIWNAISIQNTLSNVFKRQTRPQILEKLPASYLVRWIMKACQLSLSWVKPSPRSPIIFI
jgi:hypothetical protein